MPDDEKPRKVRVTDKRVTAEPRGSDEQEFPAEQVGEPEVRVVEVNRDYLDDLKRLQAEFDNYRKRMMKQQATATDSATADLVRRLLPAIDHLQLAIEHGEGGSGAQLAIKELMEALGAEGLEEVQAVGATFDPNVHEAVATREDTDVESDIVVEVQRKGYSFKGQLLRAPYVVVARPPAEEGTG